MSGGTLAKPEKVVVQVTVPPANEDEKSRTFEYVFTDVTEASLTHQVHTRGLTFAEQMEKGFPMLKEHVVEYSTVDLHLVLRPEQQ